MRRFVALFLVLACIAGFAGCGSRSMNDIIANEPSIMGIVKDLCENAILIENDNGEYWVSRNVENKDSYTDLSVGDEIVVYHDGNVMESDPLKVGTVYAITLKIPADRTENGKD